MSRFPINQDSTAELLKDFFQLLEALDGLTVSDCIDPVFVVGDANRERTAVVRVSFDSGATESSVADIGPWRLAAIYMPPAWTAADIGFEVAREEVGTYQELFDDAGTSVTITTAAGRVVGIDDAAGALAACRFIRLTSSVAQGAARDVDLILKQ